MIGVHLHTQRTRRAAAWAMSLTALSMMSASAVAREAGQPEVFKNPAIGFELTRPAGWQFRTAEENLENLEHTKLEDQQFREAMLKYATTPLVIMTRHAESTTDLNPTLKVNAKPLGPLKGMPPVEVLELLLPELEKAFADFTLAQPVSRTEVSGLAASYVRANYTLKTTGASFPATTEIWIVPRGDFFFMIAGGTRQDEKTGSRAEIQAIVKSIKLQP